MFMIFTPMVAQSSVEASLTIVFTLPFCVPPPFEPKPALELEPQATEKRGIAANTDHRKIRDNLEFIFRLLRRLGGLHSFVWIIARYDCAGPRDRAKIPASTIQNTETGRELRGTGTEVMVRKYYSGNSGSQASDAPDIPPVLCGATRTDVLPGHRASRFL